MIMWPPVGLNYDIVVVNIHKDYRAANYKLVFCNLVNKRILLLHSMINQCQPAVLLTVSVDLPSPPV